MEPTLLLRPLGQYQAPIKPPKRIEAIPNHGFVGGDGGHDQPTDKIIHCTYVYGRECIFFVFECANMMLGSG